MGFGHPGGRFTIGPTSMQANADAGLPFADVPGDLAGRVEAVLEHEPEHPDPIVDFSHSRWDRRPFGLRTFLRPHAGGLLLAVLLVVFETALLHLGPLLVQIGIDRGVLAKNTDVLVTVALVFVGSVVLAALATAVRTAFTGRIGERLVYELRVRVFSHFQRQSLGFFTAERSGVLMTRMTSDIEALTVLFQEGLIQFVVQGMTLAVVTAYLLMLNPTLALVCFAVVVPVNVLLTLWFRRVSQVGYLRVRDCIADVLADLSESLDGIRLITAFNRRRHNTVRHHNIVGAHLDANLATSRAQALYGPGTEAFGIISQAVILLVGGRMVLRNELSLGEMVAFLLFLTSFFAPIQTLVQLFNQYQQGSAAVTKLRGVLGTEPSVPERPDAHHLPPVEGHLVLDSVTFGYDPDHLVLREVDLEVAPGEVGQMIVKGEEAPALTLSPHHGQANEDGVPGGTNQEDHAARRGRGKDCRRCPRRHLYVAAPRIDRAAPQRLTAFSRAAAVQPSAWSSFCRICAATLPRRPRRTARSRRPRSSACSTGKR